MELARTSVLAEALRGQRPQSGAPLLSKFGNLSMRENLVATSAYARPYRLWGGEGGGEDEGSRKATQRGRECHLFLAGNRAVLFGNQRSKTIVRSTVLTFKA